MGPDIQQRCQDLEAAGWMALLPAGRPRAKSAWQPPLFPLLEEEAYRLALALLAALDNPYLAYARDADELCLSLRLYRHCPGLPFEALSRFHFATLLALELVRAEVRELEPPRAWDEMETEHAVRLAAAWRLMVRLEAHLAALAAPEGAPAP